MSELIRKRRVNMLVIGLGIIAIACIPLVVTSPYYLDLFISVIVNGILAMTFIVMLRTGLINLGIAAFWGIGAYCSAVMVMKLHLSFWLAFPLSALVVGGVACAVGFLIVGSGSKGFSFVIMSSVIGMLFAVVVGNIHSIGGYNGLADIPRPSPIKLPLLPEISFDSKIAWFYLALVMLIAVVLVIKAFAAAWTGRAWAAIGLNTRLAESFGVDVFKYKMVAFVLSSAIAGLVGSFYAHYQGFLTPNTFGIWVNINVQIYAILGGIGYVAGGPLLGAALMVFLPEWMRGASVYSPLVIGTILMLLVLFLPDGLLGLLRLRDRLPAKASDTRTLLRLPLWSRREHNES